MKRNIDMDRIRADGELGRRIEHNLSHLLEEKDRILGGEGHAQGWGADQFGRWIETVSAMSSYLKRDIKELDEVLGFFLKEQKETGSFSSQKSRKTWWGASKAMMGLLRCYTDHKDAAALKAAERLAGFYLDNRPIKDHHGGLEEGLVRLWDITGDKRYLELAGELYEDIDRKFGYPADDESVRGNKLVFDTVDINHHTHSYLTGIRGCVDLHIATGKKEYLEFAEDIWRDVAGHNMWVTGGISEGSGYAFETRDETCPTADWLMLNLQLWKVTGDVKYIETAERVLLNHLFFDQDHSGGFVSYRSIEEDKTGAIRDIVAWFCCSMHGGKALLEAASHIYTYDDEGIDVNFFMPSEALLDLAGREICIKQGGDILSGICISVKAGGKSRFSLNLRVPEWSGPLRVELNGKKLEVTEKRGYFSIGREWGNDTLKIFFEPVVRIIKRKSNSSFSQDDQEKAAVSYGPYILMMDPALSVHNLRNMKDIETIIPGDDEKGLYVPVMIKDIPGRGRYKVPGVCFMTFCREIVKEADETAYNTQKRGWGHVEQNDKEWKPALMVPVSEITGRWTPTTYRIVPYIVRYDVRILKNEEKDRYLKDLDEVFDDFVRRRNDETMWLG